MKRMNELQRLAPEFVAEIRTASLGAAMLIGEIKSISSESVAAGFSTSKINNTNEINGDEDLPIVMLSRAAGENSSSSGRTS